LTQADVGARLRGGGIDGLFHTAEIKPDRAQTDGPRAGDLSGEGKGLMAAPDIPVGMGNRQSVPLAAQGRQGGIDMQPLRAGVGHGDSGLTECGKARRGRDFKKDESRGAGFVELLRQGRGNPAEEQEKYKARFSMHRFSHSNPNEFRIDLPDPIR